MSDYQPQPGRGNVFKGDPDKPAAWSGKVCLPDGTMAFIDLYKATDRETGELRKDRNGDPWYNVSIKAMQKQGGSPGEPSQQQEPQSGRGDPDFGDDLNDSIPFLCW